MKLRVTENKSALISRLTGLKNSAQSCQQRWLVVINGERDWVYDIIDSVLQSSLQQNFLCISDHTFSGSICISHNKVEQYLGNEFDNIVYDAFCGLFPSTFALSEGTLKGGGLFFLLSPSLDDWPSSTDAFSQKYAMYPGSADDMSPYFITRLIRMLKCEESISIVSQYDEDYFYQTDQLKSSPKTLSADDCQTLDQKVAVEKIIHTAKGHRKRPLVLLSNRGRGKSSALGIASALLVQESHYHITVTGPRKKATINVFRHINKTLGLACNHQCYRIEYKQSIIEFIAPDELLRHPIETRLLLIDEAATIPLPILESLLRQYHRIVFSSTVYGYEGNGRGFEIRLLTKLDQYTPGWAQYKLNEPIRWANNDALEKFCFKAFLLESDYRQSTNNNINIVNIKCTHLNKNELMNNESDLQSLFGLLIHAHYKTSPNDLRMIIDSPYISIYCAFLQNKIVAAALVSTEGDILEDVAVEIMNGHRRIKGQFLPQTLISEFSQTTTAGLKFARIMRIAVDPSLHRKGIGLMLVNYLSASLADRYDFIGAGFGSDERVCHFWNKVGYLPIKVGHKKNAFSGHHSVVVIKGLSTDAHRVVEELRQQFPKRLLFLLTDSLKYLDTQVVRSLLLNYSQNIQSHINQKEYRDLNSFAHEYRDYNTCSYLIYKLILNTVHRHSISEISDSDWAILIQRVIQRQDELEVISNAHLEGRKQLQAKIRLITIQLINSVH